MAPMKQIHASGVTAAVTRSHKHNDRDHTAHVDGNVATDEHVPRYFAKSGYPDSDPTKAKKNGGGKGNWGREGDELEDYSYNLTKPRRRSNSFSTAAGHKDFKTKFETVEPEPVFEEETMGSATTDSTTDGAGETEVDKESTNSSSGGGSIEEEDSAIMKKA